MKTLTRLVAPAVALGLTFGLTMPASAQTAPRHEMSQTQHKAPTLTQRSMPNHLAKADMRKGAKSNCKSKARKGAQKAPAKSGRNQQRSERRG